MKVAVGNGTIQHDYYNKQGEVSYEMNGEMLTKLSCCRIFDSRLSASDVFSSDLAVVFIINEFILLTNFDLI